MPLAAPVTMAILSLSLIEVLQTGRRATEVAARSCRALPPAFAPLSSTFPARRPALDHNIGAAPGPRVERAAAVRMAVEARCCATILALSFFRGPGTDHEADVTEILYDQKFWLNAFFAAEWALRLAMIVIVPLRRSPDAAKGWLLLIFFEPVAGLILYLLIGRPSLPVWRLVRHADFEALSRPTHDRLAQEKNIFRPDVGPELQHAVTLAENLGDFPILGGNSAEILSDYQGTIDRLVADIELACDHVHLLFYIIADDATAGRVIAALERAVERGVACRVLADSLGSRPEFQRMLPRLLSAGILAEETMRVGFFRRHTGRIDLRNHRKDRK